MSTGMAGVSSGHPPARSGSFITSLQGLRGLLALWVVMFHANPNGVGPLKVSAYGYLAVDLFFMMSGYILMHTHALELRRITFDGSLRFLVARWWRVYPLYFACVVLSVLWMLMFGLMPQVRQVVVALLLLEGWAYPGLGVNAPVWSLGVEWVGYLAFPLIVIAQSTLTNRTAFVVIAVVQLLTLASLWQFGDDLTSDTYGARALVRMAGGFLSGCLVWTFHSDNRDMAKSSDLLLGVTLLTAAAVLLVMPAIAVLPLLLLALPMCARPGPLTRLLLDHPIVWFLGRISFALYLSHLLVLRIFQHFQSSFGMQRWLGTVAGLVAAILLATALCIAIEEPSRRFGRGLMRQRLRPKLRLGENGIGGSL